jgi:hypothetical protein
MYHLCIGRSSIAMVVDTEGEHGYIHMARAEGRKTESNLIKVKTGYITTWHVLAPDQQVTLLNIGLWIMDYKIAATPCQVNAAGKSRGQKVNSISSVTSLNVSSVS